MRPPPYFGYRDFYYRRNPSISPVEDPYRDLQRNYSAQFNENYNDNNIFQTNIPKKLPPAAPKPTSSILFSIGVVVSVSVILAGLGVLIFYMISKGKN